MQRKNRVQVRSEEEGADDVHLPWGHRGPLAKAQAERGDWPWNQKPLAADVPRVGWEARVRSLRVGAQCDDHGP